MASKDFSDIRKLLEHIYLYGFYTREDYVNAGMAGRTYDDKIRTVKDLYYVDNEAGMVNTVSQGKYKKYTFIKGYFSEQGKRLRAVYGMHPVSDSDISIILYSLFNKKRTSEIIGKEVEQYVDLHNQGDSDKSKQSTVSRRMKELKEYGYLIKRGAKYYPGKTAVLEKLEDEKLLGLYYLASFFAGAGYPRIKAAFLQDAIKRMIRKRGNAIPKDVFLFRDNAGGNVLDEHIVEKLLKCCREHRCTRIVNIRNKKESVLSPVYLRPDTRYGRWYIAGVSSGNAVLMRVSTISDVKMTNEKFNYDEALEIVDNAFSKSYISGKILKRATIVEAEMCFDNPHIEGQFEKEIILGHVEEREGKKVYCAEVNDVKELKPMLRAYGRWLHIMPGNRHGLEKEIREEYERMLKNYGAL